MTKRRRGLAASAFALALLVSACTGNRPATTVAATGDELVQETSDAPAEKAAASADRRTGSQPAARAGSAPTVRGGTATTRAPNVAGTRQTTRSGFTYKAANLFTPGRDRVGISATELRLCTHAALILGPAFQDSEEDFQVYWRWLNDNGGIYGRRVVHDFTDDQYTPSGGVQAAQQCFSSDPQPFLMMSGVGFDTVPAVRQWAEQNKQLYLASFATERGLSSLKYSFHFPPSVEHFGRVAGRYVKARHPGGSVGIVWRNSSNWQGGRDAFTKEVRSRGAKVTDLPVSQNQGNYTNEILALKAANATTVLAWINVLEFGQLEKQAAQQNYFPRWVVAGFNLVTDTVGSDINGSRGPAAIGLWVTPEYHNGDTKSPWSGEQEKMRAAYRKYRPNHVVTDTDWQVWLAFKQVTQLFLDCGKDCTRNKIAGMFLSGYKARVAPLCNVDFARGRGKIGSFQFNVWKAVPRGDASGWQQIETCKENF